MQLPSANSHKYLMVPSCLDTCFRATFGTVRVNSLFSLSRRSLGRFVISSKEVTPLWSQVKTCLPRNAGWPMAFRAFVISGRVMDFKSRIVSS